MMRRLVAAPRRWSRELGPRQEGSEGSAAVPVGDRHQASRVVEAERRAVEMSAQALLKDSECWREHFSRAWTKCVHPCSGWRNPKSPRGRLVHRSFTLATSASRLITARGLLGGLLFFLLAVPSSVAEERGPNLRITASILAPSIAADWYSSREGVVQGGREVGPLQSRIGANAGAAVAFGLETATVKLVGKKNPSLAWGMLFGFAATHLAFALCNEAKCF